MADQIDKQLEFAIKNHLNVMLIGKHGVGKTTRVLEMWEKNGIKNRYFSAATMDPFIDFIGVPKEKTCEESGHTYLDFIRPQYLEDTEIEGFFFDEFNRAPKKVRNAVMELIQFKSINGRKFPNLKYVWTAINPEDDEDGDHYDVDGMDPAQEDRFHLHITVPYEVPVEYFVRKYPNSLGSTACDWWNSLDKKQKNMVSPRRLDYAVDAYANGSATVSMIKAILPKGINSNEFCKQMKSGSLSASITKAYKDDDQKEMKRLMNGSETKTAIKTVCEIVTESKEDGDKFFKYCVDSMTDETLILLIKNFEGPTRSNLTSEYYKDRLESLQSRSLSSDVRTKIESLLGNDTVNTDNDDLDEFSDEHIEEVFTKMFGGSS